MHQSQQTSAGMRPLRIGTLHDWPDGSWSARMRKGNAGRYLDGALHDAYPETRQAVPA